MVFSWMQRSPQKSAVRIRDIRYFVEVKSSIQNVITAKVKTKGMSQPAKLLRPKAVILNEAKRS